MKRCPKCGCERFLITAHVVQEWVVDDEGDFIAESASCIEVIHQADDDDIWTCDRCGYEDVGRKFNVKE